MCLWVSVGFPLGSLISLLSTVISVKFSVAQVPGNQISNRVGSAAAAPPPPQPGPHEMGC